MKAIRSIGLVMLAAIPAVALVFSPPQAEAKPARFGEFGAVAYSSATGRYGYSFGMPSRGAAESDAVRRCGTFDAQPVAWVKNGWLALAVGDDQSLYGYGWSTNSQADAEARALRAYPGSGARIAVSFSSR